jgi:hypothetical protein
MYSMEPAPAEIFNYPMPGIIESPVTGFMPGRVVIHGTSWSARLCIPDPRCVLPPGTPVLALGRRGLTLLVIPEIF